MLGPDDHYIVISADTHAGGSHAQYREFLDEKYVADFDAWREKYKNPFKDLKDTDQRVRNWDSERRDTDQNGDGVVGEVIFPNTVPPFFPNFVLFAQPPTPEEYEHRHAGVQAHNRWLADYVSEKPAQRAGIGQVFLNDVDDAIADAKWCKENGLRGGILVGSVPPTCDWIKPLYDPAYDPLWAFCERFPNLKFTITEAGCAWIPAFLTQLDDLMAGIRANKVGEMRIGGELVPPRSASEYFQQSCHVGISQPRPLDVAAALGDKVGIDRVMWGSDYPHDEGTYPYTTEHFRQVFSGLEPEQVQQILAGNAAELYGFDLEALRPLADKFGPTVTEVRQPLTELPAEPNQALVNSAKQLAAAS